MIRLGLLLLLASAWLFTQSRAVAKLPGHLATAGLVILIMGVFK